MTDRLCVTSARALFALGVLTLLLAVAVWVRFHVQVPVRDLVYLLPLVQSGVQEGWASISPEEWFRPFNSHRIVVTRFLMLLDYTVLGGRNYAIYVSAWASIGLLLWAYARAARLQFPGDNATLYFVAGLALVFLCSPTQYLNLINPISASWYVAMAGSACALLIVISAGNHLRTVHLVAACFFATVAALSNMAGVLACLVLPVIALYQRSRLSIVLALFSFLLVFLYLTGSGLTGPGQTDAAGADTGQAALLESAGQFQFSPGRVVRYIGLQLGAPLSQTLPTVASLAVYGSVLFIVYQWVMLLYGWCMKRPVMSRSSQFYLAMATICLGVAMAIPMGRLYSAPSSLRFQTITMVYWLSVGCLLFVRARGPQQSRIRQWVFAVVACLPVLPLLGAQDYSMPAVRTLSNGANKTHILGQLGVNHHEASSHPWLRELAGYMAEHREFVAGYGFQPPAERAGVTTRERPVCEGSHVRSMATRWPGIQKVFLQLADGVNPVLSGLELRGSDGGAGRLYGHVREDSGFKSVFLAEDEWPGFYRGELHESVPLTLYVDGPFGAGYECALPVKP
jgi:hypothetical protein